MPIQAQRGCWRTALSTHNLGTRSSTPWPHYPDERPSTLVQEVWWALGLAWTGPENLSPTRIQFLDCPGRSKLLHWLCKLQRTFPKYCKINRLHSKISGFHCEVDEICTLLGYYVVLSGNSLLTFWDNNLVPFSRVNLKMGLIGCPEISVMKYHYTLHNTPEECRSLLHSSSHQDVPKKKGEHTAKQDP